MWLKSVFYWKRLTLLILFFLLFQCSGINDVEVDINPGIVRIVLQADPSDESIVILGETINVTENDSLGIKIFQGKAISKDSSYAILYQNVYSWFQEQVIYNILKRETGEYVQHIVFESMVPPGDYEAISLGIEGTLMAIGPYTIPIELPPDAESVISFDAKYKVSEKKVTEIHLQISPFKSMTRYLDSYRFSRIAQISEIRYLSRDVFDEIVAGLPWLINPNDPFRD